MSFCPYCGSKVPEDARFCPKCGKELVFNFETEIEPVSEPEEMIERSPEPPMSSTPFEGYPVPKTGVDPSMVNYPEPDDPDQKIPIYRNSRITSRFSHGELVVILIAAVAAILISGLLDSTWLGVLAIAALAGYVIVKLKDGDQEEETPNNTAISDPTPVPPVKMVSPSSVNANGMVCPICNSQNVTIQTFQENIGSTSVSKTRSHYRQKGHGLFYWLFIGWWWWAIDLMLWIFAFFPRLILRLFAAPFKRRKYVGTSTTVSRSSNDIRYRTVHTCQNCGHVW